MKKLFLITFILSLAAITGCNSIEEQITREQAQIMVIDKHEKEIGEIEIISITTKFNNYIIEWENKENCEKGTDTVNKKGELRTIDTSIC